MKGSEAIETFKKKVENEDFSKKKVLNFFCFELFSKIYSGTHSVEKSNIFSHQKNKCESNFRNLRHIVTQYGRCGILLP